MSEIDKEHNSACEKCKVQFNNESGICDLCERDTADPTNCSRYVPSWMRGYSKPSPREVSYGCGTEHGQGEFGMWFGLVSEEQDALEVAGQTQNDVVIRFNSDWTDEVIWRWDGDGWAIESSTNTEASPPKENIMNLKHIDFKPTPNEGGLSAVIIESSDDAGASWEIHGIAWTVDRAVMLARNIPWDWRLRKVTLSDAGLIGWAEITSALGTMEKLESILATGNSSSIGEGKKYE